SLENPSGLHARDETDMDADAVIIASQGNEDLAALRQALQSPASFVAMVASHRKAAHLCARLKAEGMEDSQIGRLISPAGLNLGGIDPHEIAVSILAQLISHRRGGGASGQ
ncbi:MAG: XdhC family protein, partial [Pseudomonadota bacterium]